MSNRSNSKKVTIAPPTETIAPPTETIAPPTETIAPPTETIAPPTETIAPPTETIAPPTETIAPPTETIAPPTETIASYQFEPSFLTVPVYFECKGYSLYLAKGIIFTNKNKPIAKIDKGYRVIALSSAYESILDDIRSAIASKVQGLLYSKIPSELRALGLTHEEDHNTVAFYQARITKEKHQRSRLAPKPMATLQETIDRLEKSELTKTAARSQSAKKLAALGL